jgi:alpha-tubulin suppressor-like RCC1 family protein
MHALLRLLSASKISVLPAAATLLACSDSTAPVEGPGELRVRWVSIAAGGSDFVGFSCGLTDAGAAYCWGSNSSGALGTAEVSESRVPVPVAGGVRFRSIAPGSRHVCGVAVDGTVHCWGLWQLSEIGSPLQVLGTPRTVPTGRTLSDLTSGSWNTCGLAEDGAALCWSGHPYHHAEYGMAGVPQAVSGGVSFTSISAGNHGGESFWCGLAGNGDAYCWGSNFYGTLGIGTFGPGTNRAEPTPVLGGLRFQKLATGYIACGILESGAVYCWGPERSYPPFQDDIAGGTGPTPLRTEVLFESISAGRDHACGLAPGGKAYCWGSNSSGQLGNGSDASGSNTPVPVAGGIVFRTLSAGNGHSCGTTAAGEAYCWGRNDGGQLGDGSAPASSRSADSSRVPVQVRGPRVETR